MLLTGASSGVGRALANELGRRGARLVLAARREPELRSVADSVERGGGHRPVVVRADLSDPDEAARLAARATEAWGRIDVLVNNAAQLASGPQWGTEDIVAARRAFETNYWSAVALTAALAPAMRDAGGGVVLNVSSLAVSLPLRGLGFYAASKAALSAATDALQLELRGTSVAVVHVVLGSVDTPLLMASTRESGTVRAARWMPAARPQRAASAIADVIERPRTRLIFPRSVAVPVWLPMLGRFATRFVRQDVAF